MEYHHEAKHNKPVRHHSYFLEFTYLDPNGGDNSDSVDSQLASAAQLGGGGVKKGPLAGTSAASPKRGHVECHV